MKLSKHDDIDTSFKNRIGIIYCLFRILEYSRWDNPLSFLYKLLHTFILSVSYIIYPRSWLIKRNIQYKKRTKKRIEQLGKKYNIDY